MKKFLSVALIMAVVSLLENLMYIIFVNFMN